MRRQRYWSRRINDEHRIVYKVLDGDLLSPSYDIATDST
ncbi:type II toxin-antitoxin system YoeB family toxin [Sinimarinibacterium sp. NLF-5-8]